MTHAGRPGGFKLDDLAEHSQGAYWWLLADRGIEPILGRLNWRRVAAQARSRARNRRTRRPWRSAARPSRRLRAAPTRPACGRPRRRCSPSAGSPGWRPRGSGRRCLFRPWPCANDRSRAGVGTSDRQQRGLGAALLARLHRPLLLELTVKRRGAGTGGCAQMAVKDDRRRGSPSRSVLLPIRVASPPSWRRSRSRTRSSSSTATR